MRHWLACGLLIAICGRIAWVGKSRVVTETAILVAGMAVLLTLLR